MLRKYREIIFLVVLFIIFITIRSLHYSESLDFSSDQGAFSAKAYNLFQNREFTLIGPTTSINFEGRQIFQGSVIYYFLLIFLLMGNFEPVTASYLFMLFCGLMIIPLFFGVKLLINQKAAIFVVLVYSLLPLFINHTKFFWNPNFQLALSAILILLMGYYKKRQSKMLLFTVGAFASFLLLFHYQFILVLIGLAIYYFISAGAKKIIFLFAGYIVGFSPMLLFEVRSNFYTLNTLFFYYQNLNQVLSGQQNMQNNAHYYLSLALLLVVLISYIVRKLLTYRILSVAGLILLVFALITYLPKPSNAFGMSQNWNYKQEEKVFNIIKSSSIEDFNVTNLIYDTKAEVQRYLILKDGLSSRLGYSYDNEYLFVIAANDKNISADPAFEITSIKPFTIVNSWAINEYYRLSLLKRDSLPTPSSDSDK